MAPTLCMYTWFRMLVAYSMVKIHHEVKSYKFLGVFVALHACWIYFFFTYQQISFIKQKLWISSWYLELGPLNIPKPTLTCKCKNKSHLCRSAWLYTEWNWPVLVGQMSKNICCVCFDLISCAPVWFQYICWSTWCHSFIYIYLLCKTKLFKRWNLKKVVFI